MQSRTLLVAALAVALLAAGGFGVLASSSGAQEPGTAVHFQLVVGNKTVGAFAHIAVSSSADEVDTLELSGRGAAAAVKVTSPQRPPTITLRRGLSSNTDVWEWRARVESGGVDAARESATIVLYDQAQAEIARWTLRNAWPVKVTGASTDAGIPTESVTLVADSVRYAAS